MLIAAYRMGEQGWTAKEAMRDFYEPRENFVFGKRAIPG